MTLMFPNTYTPEKDDTAQKPGTEVNRFSQGFCDRLRILMTYSIQKHPDLADFTNRMREESILQAQLESQEPKPFLEKNLPNDLLPVIDILFGAMGQPPEEIGDQLFPSSYPAYHTFLNTHGVWGKDQYSKGVDATVPVELKTGGTFVVHATCDNIGEYFIDGNSILTSSDWTKIESTTVELTKGTHEIRVKGQNTGGPASLAMTLTDAEGNIAFSTRDWEKYAPKGGETSDVFPGANIIALPEGIWQIATEQWDDSIAKHLHVEGAYAGAGTHPFAGLGSLNIYSPHEFHIRASDAENNPLNMLAAVKDDAALVQGPKFKLKFETTTADNLADSFAPLPERRKGLPPNTKGYKGSGKVDSVITYDVYQMSMKPIIDVWFNKMHQILNDNTMFQVVSDLYTGAIPVTNNKPIYDQETYKQYLEKEATVATQEQIESLRITGIPQFKAELTLESPEDKKDQKEDPKKEPVTKDEPKEEPKKEAPQKEPDGPIVGSPGTGPGSGTGPGPNPIPSPIPDDTPIPETHKHTHYSEDFWDGLTNDGEAITQLHTVKVGDSFSSIAAQYNMDLIDAILLNPNFDQRKVGSDDLDVVNVDHIGGKGRNPSLIYPTEGLFVYRDGQNADSLRNAKGKPIVVSTDSTVEGTYNKRTLPAPFKDQDKAKNKAAFVEGHLDELQKTHIFMSHEIGKEAVNSGVAATEVNTEPYVDRLNDAIEKRLKVTGTLEFSVSQVLSVREAAAPPKPSPPAVAMPPAGKYGDQTDSEGVPLDIVPPTVIPGPLPAPVPPLVDEELVKKAKRTLKAERTIINKLEKKEKAKQQSKSGGKAKPKATGALIRGSMFRAVPDKQRKKIEKMQASLDGLSIMDFVEFVLRVNDYHTQIGYGKRKLLDLSAMEGKVAESGSNEPTQSEKVIDMLVTFYARPQRAFPEDIEPIQEKHSPLVEALLNAFAEQLLIQLDAQNMLDDVVNAQDILSQVQTLNIMPDTTVNVDESNVNTKKRLLDDAGKEITSGGSNETFEGPLAGMATIVQALKNQGMSNTQIYQQLGDADNNGVTDQKNSRARQVGGRSSVDNALDKAAGKDVPTKKRGGAGEAKPGAKKPATKKKVLRKAKKGKAKRNPNEEQILIKESEGRLLNAKELAALPNR